MLFPRAALVATLAALAGCGASEREVRRAEASAYRGNFALVYGQALQAVRALYPHLVERAEAGVIQTAWHLIKIKQSQASAASVRGQAGAAGADALGTGGGEATGYFVRFRVSVVGGDPWRIQIEGHASEWRAGEVPVPLRGADEPPWLAGRVAALRLAIHRRLARHAVRLPPRAPAAAPPPVRRFPGVPAAAGAVLAAVETACERRDFAALRSHMRDDFAWSAGAPGSADTAVVMWRADGAPLSALASALAAGCRALGSDRVVCPARGGVGDEQLRAVFQRSGSRWQMASFHAGE
jgi:hypothetical protein